MQITRQVEYAIRALIELASTPEGELVQSRAIAIKHELPEKFLIKTVQLLIKAGLVESRRGMKGGVRLLVSPASITILDIIRAIEGNVAINPCLSDNYYCKFKEHCRVNKILQRAQDAMLTELNKETLEELVSDNQKDILAKPATKG